MTGGGGWELISRPMHRLSARIPMMAYPLSCTYCNPYCLICDSSLFCCPTAGHCMYVNYLFLINYLICSYQLNRPRVITTSSSSCIFEFFVSFAILFSLQCFLAIGIGTLENNVFLAPFFFICALVFRVCLSVLCVSVCMCVLQVQVQVRP